MKYQKELEEEILGKFIKLYRKKLNELRAIKIIELDENEIEIANVFIEGLKNMKICSNDNKNLYSVRLYEYFKYKNDLAIVMELCDNN